MKSCDVCHLPPYTPSTHTLSHWEVLNVSRAQTFHISASCFQPLPRLFAHAPSPGDSPTVYPVYAPLWKLCTLVTAGRPPCDACGAGHLPCQLWHRHDLLHHSLSLVSLSSLTRGGQITQRQKVRTNIVPWSGVLALATTACDLSAVVCTN